MVQVYVLKRPHVDEFLQTMGKLFECVLFTASLGKVSVSIDRRWTGLRTDESRQTGNSVLIAQLVRMPRLRSHSSCCATELGNFDE